MGVVAPYPAAAAPTCAVSRGVARGAKRTSGQHSETDNGWTMVSRKRALLVTAGAVVLVASGIAGATLVQSRYAPEQPIAFPHDLHAGTNQIPCMYCHSYADRSSSAGIPAVEVCAGCHVTAVGVVPPEEAQAAFLRDNPEVTKLLVHWQRQEPIPWVRVYDLPDHAHFPHMRHVNAGLECQECHGPVQEMPVVEKYASLQMGWCIDCHREREVRTDCTVCHY